MKYLILEFLLFPYLLTAQQDSTLTDSLQVWQSTGSAKLNFSNVALKNWAGGGNAALSLSTDFNYEIGYDGDRVLWENQVDLLYGVTKQGDAKDFRKTDDQLIIRSHVGYQLDKKSNFSFLTELRTQIGRGYQYASVDSLPSKTLISSFLSPGYLTMNIGYTYRKKNVFSLTISPLSGKLTIVENDSLSTEGAFGITPGSSVRNEIGASFIGNVKFAIFENINFRLTADLFSNYSSNFSVDVNSRAAINMKVNEFLTSGISATLIYDDDVMVTKDDGSMGRAVQFRNTINLGLSISF